MRNVQHIFEKMTYVKIKKRSSPEFEEFLSPKSSEEVKTKRKRPKTKALQRSNPDHSQIIGGIYLPPGISRPLQTTTFGTFLLLYIRHWVAAYIENPSSFSVFWSYIEITTILRIDLNSYTRDNTINVWL